MAGTKIEQQIKEYEDTMFGLMLYNETAPKWVKIQQERSYKNIKRRGEKAIREAKKILSDAKQGKQVQNKTRSFEWPVIIDEMRFRIKIMLQCYEELFPERPRERSLSEEEKIALQNDAMKRIKVEDV